MDAQALFKSFFSYKNFSLEENENSYLLKMEFPGIPKENLNITYDQDYLDISICKIEDIEPELSEKYKGRSFELEGIDYPNAKAKYKDGLLTLFLPKKENQKSTHTINLE